MCVTYPGRVLELDGTFAVVDIEGERRRASLVIAPETRVGDWVIVAVGTVLEILDPAEADKVRRLLADESNTKPSDISTTPAPLQGVDQ